MGRSEEPKPRLIGMGRYAATFELPDGNAVSFPFTDVPECRWGDSFRETTGWNLPAEAELAMHRYRSGIQQEG